MQISSQRTFCSWPFVTDLGTHSTSCSLIFILDLSSRNVLWNRFWKVVVIRALIRRASDGVYGFWRQLASICMGINGEILGRVYLVLILPRQFGISCHLANPIGMVITVARPVEIELLKFRTVHFQLRWVANFFITFGIIQNQKPIRRPSWN